jgi:translation initiation factor IF-2
MSDAAEPFGKTSPYYWSAQPGHNQPPRDGVDLHRRDQTPWLRLPEPLRRALAELASRIRRGLDLPSHSDIALLADRIAELDRKLELLERRALTAPATDVMPAGEAAAPVPAPAAVGAAGASEAAPKPSQESETGDASVSEQAEAADRPAAPGPAAVDKSSALAKPPAESRPAVANKTVRKATIKAAAEKRAASPLAERNKSGSKRKGRKGGRGGKNR